MQSDMLMFTVSGAEQRCDSMPASRLAKLGILETTHLEKWIVDHPEVLGDGVMIVTTQYDKWSSGSGDLARERLDVLGLDSSGQLVVVELKREKDSRIHLQAITYAALVAGFSKETLAEAHAEYLNRTGVNPTSTAEAWEQLEEHVDGTWDADLLTVPKIVLLAEDFSAQTFTTVSWLSGLTPNLSIEMHTVNAFLLPDGTAQQSCVVFRRLYPPVDPSTRVLTPGLATTAADMVATKIAENKRRTRSTYRLYDADAIPEGAQIQLNLRAWISPDIASAVDEWVAADPTRGLATWVRDRERPLLWAAARPGEGGQTPTSLAKQIVLEATGQVVDSIAGADVWHYKGQSLAALARKCDEA
jgi:hypothetical protein